jgi:hypothetical protein
MIINEKITAIIDAIRANTRRINELEQAERRFFEKNPSETPEELHARYTRHRAEREAATAERKELEVENAILRDNARRATFDAVMPQAVAILKKYNGKQYGPRTAEKISDELKAACGCALRLVSGKWLQDIDITPLNEQGYSDTAFRYDDFSIYRPTDGNGNKTPILTAENRINAADLDAADLRLYDCHEYTDNPREHAQHILTELEKLDKQCKEFEAAISAFNAMLPSGIDSRRADNFKNYI